MAEKEVNILISEFLDIRLIEQYKLIYQFFLNENKASVQIKPNFNSKEFEEILHNPEILKISLRIGGEFAGFFLLTNNLNHYKNSHYSESYFSTRYNNSLKEYWFHVKPFFLYGDFFGFYTSKSKDEKFFKLDKSIFFKILKKIKKDLSEQIGKKIILVLNYSELSIRTTGYHFAKEIIDQNRTDTLNADILRLDEETFAHIHWEESFAKKTRAEWLLKIFGNFKFSPIGETEIENQVIYANKSFLPHRFVVKRVSNIDSELQEEIYSLYHERLQGVNQISPQKLEYSKNDFLGYLRCKDYNKYLLFDENKKVQGLCLLIGKENSKLCNWVTISWKVADAYVKIILTRKGIPGIRNPRAT